MRDFCPSIDSFKHINIHPSAHKSCGKRKLSSSMSAWLARTNKGSFSWWRGVTFKMRRNILNQEIKLVHNACVSKRCAKPQFIAAPRSGVLSVIFVCSARMCVEACVSFVWLWRRAYEHVSVQPEGQEEMSIYSFYSPRPIWKSQ